LKKTGVKLELITDVDQYNYVSRGICGGATKHSKNTKIWMINMAKKNL